MKTKRSQEAYLLVDHRNSPGLTPEFMKKNGLEGPAVGAGKTLETAMAVCHCCQRDIILNPDRTRERAYCSKHDAYTCDFCSATHRAGMDCIPFQKRFEKWFNILAKGGMLLFNKQKGV